MTEEYIEFEQHVERGCGIVVHKETVVITVMGTGIKQETREYRTYTNDLNKAKQWLKELDVTHMAMESTGIYWRPVWNIMEDSFKILLVNARHIKNVPGHKTDKKDSEWIAKLLLSGLLKGSFIPPEAIRQLRDMVRLEGKYIAEISSDKNRMIKMLEDANIKLSSVLTDVFGVTGSRILYALATGNVTASEMASWCVHHRIKKSQAEIAEALTGRVTPHHRRMLQLIWKSIESKEQLVSEIAVEIDKLSEPYRQQIQLLDSIPGVDKKGAVGIISEIGIDMSSFKDENHLASWAGLSPGNNESAGKKKVDEPLMVINN